MFKIRKNYLKKSLLSNIRATKPFFAPVCSLMKEGDIKQVFTDTTEP